MAKIESVKTVLEKPKKIGDFVIIGEVPERYVGKRIVRIGPGSIIRSHTVIYVGVEIGRDFQTGHGVLIRENTIIGNEVSIGSGTVIEHRVKIGNGVRIHSNTFIPEFTEIKNGVWIGPNVVITNSKYPNTPNSKKMLKGPILESMCVIGANVTILPGVKIGKGAIVGAGSVVVRDLPPGVVVVGNPARVIKNSKQLDAYRERNRN
jgi:acetyltransferase-like isoleucine patch superfamily enzyme